MKSVIRYTLYFIFFISLLTGAKALHGGVVATSKVASIASAAIDSELRCMSVFWIAYGAFCFWVALNFDGRHYFIPAIAWVMLFSAIARVLSIYLVGSPGVQLLFAMGMEFVLFLAIFFCYKQWSGVDMPKN